MKSKIRKCLLGILDLALAAGAIYTGYLMMFTEYGIFDQYPREWIGILPFHNWIIPGILAVIIFGLGNMIASVLCFLEKYNRYWVASAIMGGILLLTMLFLGIILKEYYLATLELIFLAMIQLSLCIASAWKVKEPKLI